MLPTYQMDAQNRILGVREPSPAQFARIYEPLLRRRGIPGDVFQAVAEMIRQLFSIGIANADLGAARKWLLDNQGETRSGCSMG
jgi:hypothetical protein